MKNVIILDLDGVLITTPPWKPDEIHPDGYSDFNRHAVQNLNELLSETDAQLLLSSSRRRNKTLANLNLIFSNRGINRELTGFLPIGTDDKNRATEIRAFLNHESIQNFLILDDDRSLHDLDSNQKDFWVQADPLIGLNAEKLREARRKIAKWGKE